MITLVCKQCGEEFSKPSRYRTHLMKFCSQKCSGVAQRGPNHYKWSGGRSVNDGSYVLISNHSHPKSVNGRVYEHVLIAEKVLGKHLPSGSEVHHVDGNGCNNTPSNLVICQDHAYHMLLEARTKRFRDCGSLDSKRCCTCKQVKLLNEFPVRRTNWDGKYNSCLVCSRERMRKRPLIL